MTTLLQQMQTGPVRANEIFAKLADTSPTAVKTRERLFADLKGEIDRQAAFEEERLFPVLEKHEETKDLVGGALDETRRMRELLAEVERDPKDSEAFGSRLTELRDIFQRHLRDDSKEILPPVVKALRDEEAGAGEEKTEAEIIEITPARRADAGEHRPEEKHEEARVARRGAEIAEAGANLAQQGARVARMATEANADAGRSMVALLNEQAQHALQVQMVMAAGHAQRLAEVARVQSAFIADSFQRMGQLNDRYLALMRSWGGLLSFPPTRR